MKWDQSFQLLIHLCFFNFSKNILFPGDPDAAVVTENTMTDPPILKMSVMKKIVENIYICNLMSSEENTIENATHKQ